MRYVHQNLVICLDTGEFPEAGIYYCVRDFVDASTLQDALNAGKRFHVGQVLEIGRKIVRALEPIHEENEVHGSIKPSNIFLCKGDRIKLGDPSLPISFVNPSVERLTYDYCYVAPEAFSGDRTLVPASDFYSLGCVLHELAYGSPPFVANTPFELAALHMGGKLPATGPVQEGFTPAFYAFLAGLLRRDPLYRPRSIRHVLEGIERMATGTTTRPSQGPERIVDTQFEVDISPEYSMVSFGDPGDVYGTVIRRTPEPPSDKPPGVEKGDIAAEKESAVRPKRTSMIPERRWQQINTLLNMVLELPPDKRQAYLAVSAKDDPDLYGEVLSLLRAHDQAHSFLKDPTYDASLIPLVTEETIDPLVGQEVDGYRILGVLGRGGMGIVYKAENQSLGRMVALKVIAPDLAQNEEFLKRFRREARALAQLYHPHIVLIFALRQADLGLYIAMEYVEGQTLADHLQTHSPIAWPQALPLIKQLLSALDYAHERGIIHRDLKPRNIMLTEQGEVKVMDFGLAKMLGQGSGETTVTGARGGTLCYMSPEQARGLKNVDHRSDLFSLGLTLYEVLAGRLPFRKDDSDFIILKAIVEKRFPSPDTFNRTLPRPLSKIIMKALEKNPAKRYQSAGEMLAAIEAFEKQEQEPTTLDLPRVKDPSARRRGRVYALLAAALLLVGFGGYLIWRFL